MKIIHISDIHLTIPGEPMGGLNPHDRLAQVLADVTARHADAARIVITGDLAHWGEVPAYHALRDAIAPLPIPTRLLIGNHDDRANFLSVFPDHPVDENGFVNHAEDIAETRFLYLDSTAPRTHAGHFGPERLAWLRHQLDGCAHARLFLHHNPLQLGLPAADRIGLIPQDRTPFLDLVSHYSDRIDYIHFGHVHAPISGVVRGVPFASIPSTGNQSLPDLSEPDWLQGAPLPPAYAVHLITGRETISHLIPFAFDGAVTRSGTGWEDWSKPAPVPA